MKRKTPDWFNNNVPEDVLDSSLFKFKIKLSDDKTVEIDMTLDLNIDYTMIQDDLIDIPILRRVGFPVAVSNGVNEVKRYAKYITSCSGGRGAVREVIEEIMKAQGLWDREVKKYEDL